MSGDRPGIIVVSDTHIGAGAHHGLRQLAAAAQAKGLPLRVVTSLGEVAVGIEDHVLICGLPESPAVRDAADSLDPQLPAGHEALLIAPLDGERRHRWLVAGSDDRGLMYALLDLADRVGWAPGPAEPFSEVVATAESAAVRERSLSIYTMQKADFERRFFDPAYWDRYLDMLARHRFNTFTLILGYENAGYFAPPYPYFFDVGGYPNVHVVGYTPEMQAHSLAALHRLIAQVHARGLDFVLAIWDHVYRAGVQSGGVAAAADQPLPWRVAGVTQENLMDYSVAALTRLLELVPELDGLQFRMHGESGLTEAEMDVFWARIYDVIMAHAPSLRFDARAKGFPDHLIDLALEKGVKIRICTKYWMEQMGLPFHPTHIHPQNQHDRRHGYADLLRYPRRYSILWRLWNGGTSRVLLWGDPDHARRFAESTHLYDGDGFDVNEPLATKMASHDHDAEPFDLLQAPYRHYDWEFERYWHFYQVFGRMGYAPETPPEVWEREFARRFGAEAGPHAMRGLHLASQILPRIVAYTYPYSLFPTTRGWVEKECMGDLPTYAQALPSDTQQFLSLAEEARNQLEGEVSAKVRPQATAAWFDRIAAAVLDEAARAEIAAGATPPVELAVTLTDLRILAHLARYHARRAHAGVAYALFEQSQDVTALDAAIDQERQAIAAWNNLVSAADDVYADDLRMGLESAGLSGHWRGELAVLREGLRELEAQHDAYTPPVGTGAPWLAHVPVRVARPGQPISVHATATASAEPVEVRVCFCASSGDLQCVPLAQGKGARYHGEIPVATVEPGLRYFLEAVDAAGARTVYPGNGEVEPIPVVVTDDDQPPVVVHTPVTSANVGKPIRVRATVRDGSGVAWVRLCYRPLTQFEDYRTREMALAEQPDVYEAVIPAGEIDPTWDVVYLIEAMDNAGNGAIYPNLETETPYIVVHLERPEA